MLLHRNKINKGFFCVFFFPGVFVLNAISIYQKVKRSIKTNASPTRVKQTYSEKKEALINKLYEVMTPIVLKLFIDLVCLRCKPLIFFDLIHPLTY